MIKEITTKNPSFSRLDNKIKKGIQDLKDLDVVIKQADKNLGLVPIRGDIYNAMLRKHLEPPTFRPVTMFPHKQILRKLYEIIKAPYTISPDLKNEWLNHANASNNPCPFYVTPKLHKKGKLASRPISAQHSYLLAPVSCFISKILQPAVDEISSIARNTTQVVKQLEALTVFEPNVLVTYDVEACYPSMDISHALTVLHQHVPQMRFWNNMVTKLLHLINFNNFVSANDKIYLQTKGIATGTQVAPPFTNLYLYHVFKPILEHPAIIFESRYIDDGFMIVKSREKAEQIMKELNEKTCLNLTWNISNHEAIFLDLTIYKGQRYETMHKLDLKPYFKPTNKLLYLPAKSCHPIAMKNGIVTGEAIRTLRNSSSKLEWLKALRFVFKGLLSRGHKPQHIQEKWKKIKFEDRNKFLNNTLKRNKPKGPIVLTTYHPHTRIIWESLLKRYPITRTLVPRSNLQWTDEQKKLLKNWPPQIVWTNFKKVGQMAISANQNWSYPYKRRRVQDEKETETRAIKKRKIRHDHLIHGTAQEVPQS